MTGGEVVREHAEGLLLIGRRERVSFPEWGVRRVRAKIDTGAYSSVLDVEKHELADGGRTARLFLRLRRRGGERVQVVEAAAAGEVAVRNPGGRTERRLLIEPLVKLGPFTRRIRLTVSDRRGMRCGMLLGRQALAGCFLIDVSRKDLL
jgi:hypothetical protein